MDRKCELMQAALRAMSTDEAAAFSRHFDEAMNRAYDWGLWGAAYVINGGCSDDSFSDFRASLVSRGSQTFETALADPDSLANSAFNEDAWFYEGFQYAVHEGAEAVVYPQELPVIALPGEPSGTPWGEDPAKLKARYPRLWQKFESEPAKEEKSSKPNSKPWWKIW